MKLCTKGYKVFISIIVTVLFFLFVLFPSLVYATHFPDPAVYTPTWADFMGNLTINGQAAQPGDEVAFFDPQGVLCGHFVISSTNGNYGRVYVYGDDTTTSQIDEGAVSGDILTVKVWDSRAGQELEGNNLVLSTPPVWQSLGSTALNIETATHFPKLLPPYPRDVSLYIGYLTILGKPANIGDEIAIFDPNNVLSGHFIITSTGENGLNYGYISIYGDDPSSPSIDEGAEPGDILTFKVWDRKAGIEYSGEHLRLSPGQHIGYSVASAIPPVWTIDVGYVLNIEVVESGSGVTKGDLNADGNVDLSDVLVALELLTGQTTSGIRQDYTTSGTDVEGNNRVGLAEAIYSMQRLAKIRP